MKKILIVATGSIACVKIPEIIKLFKEKNYQLDFVLTEGAKQFITPLSIASLNNAPVYDNLFSLKDEAEMGHIRLSRESDLILVLPASFNFINKVASGIADDLASTVVAASNKPVIFVPAMNYFMWHNKILSQNILKLKNLGYSFLDTEEGELACGEYGDGRLLEPKKIVQQVEEFFHKSLVLRGKKIIITAGATVEKIDPVRFISNHSSGKQGYYIAKKLSENGAEVLLILGKNELKDNSPNIKVVNVSSANEMLEKVKENLPADIFISAAAVCDFKIETYSKDKIKKQNKNLELKFDKTVDVLKEISQSKKRPRFVIGFAAESNNLVENAKIKLKEKNLDLIIANDIKGGEVFGGEENSLVYFIDKKSAKKIDAKTKQQVADKVLEYINNLYGNN